MQFLARALLRFRPAGRGRVPAGAVVLASAHVSRFDPVLVRAALGRPLHVFDGTNAGLRRAADALRGGGAVLAFPEGGRTRNGQLRPFRRGFLRLLSACPGTPVVPVSLGNVWGMAGSRGGRRAGGPEPWFARRRVTVQFGEPIPADAATVDAVRAGVVFAGAEGATAEAAELPEPPRAFVRVAAKWANARRAAFVDSATGTERRLTWPQALVGAWSLARWLGPRLGTPGEPVGVWLPTGLGCALANLALGLLGRTTVNLNYTAGPAAVHAAVRLAGVTRVVSALRFRAKMPLDLPPGVEWLSLEEALGATTKGQKLRRMLAVLALPSPLLERLIGVPRRGPDDVLTVVFSSGSTGEPKGVQLTHRNIAGNVEAILRGLELRREDVMLAALPIFHSFGYTVCLWAPCVVGMTAVFHPDPRAAQEVGALCRRHRCTIQLGTATFLRLYLRRCDAGDFRSLRLLICGAEKLPVPLALEFEKAFGVLPLEGYGCTEVSPVVGTSLPDAPGQRANRLGCVGQPLPGVAVRAFDPEAMAQLPTGAEGLLGVAGPNVMLGYLNDPARTAACLAGGWYVSGDVGRVEPDGFVRITGRLARFAKIAGEMVPLERVEEELHDLLGGGGERLLALAAVPDAKRGERLVLLHLPAAAAGLQAALDGLRGRGLPNLWVPDRRDAREVETLPALGSGKLDLRALAELAARLGGG